MLNKSKSVSVSGSSIITVDGVEKVAMTMNASIREDGSVISNKNIQSTEVYKANKAAVKADYAEFETYVELLMEEEE